LGANARAAGTRRTPALVDRTRIAPAMDIERNWPALYEARAWVAIAE
jgi:hypothetical protein